MLIVSLIKVGVTQCFTGDNHAIATAPYHHNHL